MATDSTLPPAPAAQSATATTTPASTPSATPAPAAPTQTASSKDYKAEYERIEAEHQRKVREQIAERRKWDTEKKTFAEKLKAADEYEKVKRLAQANPDGFLRQFYGENAKDKLAAVWANGGVPTGEMLAYELAKQREELMADFERRLAERESKASSAAEEAHKARLQEARQVVLSEANEFWEASAKEYPAIKGTPQQVSQYLAQRIESEFMDSGKRLTAKEMADKIEAEIISHAEEVAAAAKYQEKLKAKLMPPPAAAAPRQQSSLSQQPQRKTLTNGMTAAAQGKAPALSEKERLERAQAAYANFRNARTQ